MCASVALMASKRMQGEFEVRDLACGSGIFTVALLFGQPMKRRSCFGTTVVSVLLDRRTGGCSDDLKNITL